MYVKSKDAALVKCQRELDQARQQINRFEREVDSLKTQLAKARIIQDNQSVLESPPTSQRTMSPMKSPPMHDNSSQATKYEAPEGKENNFPHKTKEILEHRLPSSLVSNGSLTTASNGQSNTEQNFQNAAELTARLRAKIESLKRGDKQRL